MEIARSHSRTGRIARALALVICATSLVAVGGSGASAQTQAALPDVTYGTASGVNLLMDVYLPAGEGPFPGVIVIHGGGFQVGDKEQMRFISTELSQDGYAAFAIDYRLAPDFYYPAALEDALHAVEFVREHAAEYGVDPDRIGVLGTSAGAMLATLIGGLGQGSSRVSAVVSWSGPADLVTIQQQMPRMAGEILDSVFGPGVTQEDLAQASPVNHIGPGYPPAFVANSPHELVPFAQAQELDAKLQEAGVPHELWTAPGGHAIAYQRFAIGPSLDFLDRYLKSGASPTSPGPSTSTGPGRRAGALSWVLLGLVILVALLVGAYLLRRRSSGGDGPRP